MNVIICGANASEYSHKSKRHFNASRIQIPHLITHGNPSNKIDYARDGHDAHLISDTSQPFVDVGFEFNLVARIQSNDHNDNKIENAIQI